MNRDSARSKLRGGLFVGLLAVLSLSYCTSDNPDYPDLASCSPGDRQCGTPRDRPIALVCGRDSTDALTWLEEPCPVSSVCDSGRCAPPAGAKACERQADCATGQSCVPLVDNGQIALFCVTSQPAAAIGPAAQCSHDSDCQTYRCLQHPQQLYCLQACSGDSQCTPPAICRTLNITITGVQGTARSCGPP